MRDRELEKLAASSRRASILSTFGVVIVISSLVYSAYKLANVERTVAEKQREVEALIRKIEGLKSTQDSLLDFVSKVTDETKVSILGRDVDWKTVKSDLEQLPGGKRKETILTAILLAWKDIPFTMGQQAASKGFDSPRFLYYVLSKNGVRIDKGANERMSDALMRTFKKVEKPKPGDLIFYRGQEGSFGFFYLADGKSSNAGVGIGTLQAVAPLQIINLDNINTRYFPLIGYFRVSYPDETGQAQPRALADAPQAARP